MKIFFLCSCIVGIQKHDYTNNDFTTFFAKELQDYTNAQQRRNANERGEKCMLSADIHKESTYYLLKGTRLKTIYSLRNCQLIIFW